MKTVFPLLIILAITVSACSSDSNSGTSTPPKMAGVFAQTSSDRQVAAADPERLQRIKENLEFQLRDQIQGQEIAVGEIQEDIIDGFDGGLVMIGQQTLQFITSKDDKNLFLVVAGPFDVSLSSEERAEAEKEAAAALAQQETERSDELSVATADLPSRGPDGAPVALVEFSDFQCPFCKGASGTVEKLMEKYEGQIQFSYMHFPLNMHPWAMPAAITASCTSTLNHDAFWTLHDAYFANQDDITPENLLEKSRGFLTGTDIDMAAWSECAENPASESHSAAVAAVQQSIVMGNRYGLTGTPGFFINGKFVRGAPPIDQFSAIIDEALSE